MEDGSSSLDSTAGTAIHYERMLSQVHELQEDLSKTLSVAQRLRAENTSLRDTYDEVCCLRNLATAVSNCCAAGRWGSGQPEEKVQ